MYDAKTINYMNNVYLPQRGIVPNTMTADNIQDNVLANVTINTCVRGMRNFNKNVPGL